MDAKAHDAVGSSAVPSALGRAEQIRFLLRYALLAPSTRNTQPWVFESDANHARIYADFLRWRPIRRARRPRYRTMTCGGVAGNVPREIIFGPSNTNQLRSP